VTELAQQDDRRLFGVGEVLMVALPASASMLSRTIMRFADGVMVSRVSNAAFASQLVAGMLAFAYEALIMGTLTAVNTYVSQNLGARRESRCGEYARSGLVLSLVLAAAVQPLILLGGRGLFEGILNQPAELVPLESMYFRYMILSVLVAQPAMVFARFFYGIERSGVVFWASTVGNGTNIVFNYILIFGKFGFPAMGLEGAAIGTILGTVLELAVFTAVFLSPAIHRRFQTRRFQASWRQCKDIVRVGWPAGVQFFTDLTGWGVVTSVLIGGFGALHLAAHTAVIRYISLSFMPAIGVGIAATALVGKYIGAGRPDLARRRAHAALAVGVGYMGLCGLAFFLFRAPLIDFFANAQPVGDLTPAQAAENARTIVRLGSQLMICAAVFQVFDAMAIVYMGALRGAGDTFWPMIASICLTVGVLVGGGTLMVNVFPSLQALGPWLASTAFVICFGVAMALRFESSRWQEIDLLGRSEEKPEPTFLTEGPASVDLLELPEGVKTEDAPRKSTESNK
jgi:MATE family multidrug resistance protein